MGWGSPAPSPQGEQVTDTDVPGLLEPLAGSLLQPCPVTAEGRGMAKAQAHLCHPHPGRAAPIWETRKVEPTLGLKLPGPSTTAKDAGGSASQVCARNGGGQRGLSIRAESWEGGILLEAFYVF